MKNKTLSMFVLVFSLLFVSSAQAAFTTTVDKGNLNNNQASLILGEEAFAFFGHTNLPPGAMFKAVELSYSLPAVEGGNSYVLARTYKKLFDGTSQRLNQQAYVLSDSLSQGGVKALLEQAIKSLPEEIGGYSLENIKLTAWQHSGEGQVRHTCVFASVGEARQQNEQQGEFPWVYRICPGNHEFVMRVPLNTNGVDSVGIVVHVFDVNGRLSKEQCLHETSVLFESLFSAEALTEVSLSSQSSESLAKAVSMRLPAEKIVDVNYTTAYIVVTDKNGKKNAWVSKLNGRREGPRQIEEYGMLDNPFAGGFVVDTLRSL